MGKLVLYAVHLKGYVFISLNCIARVIESASAWGGRNQKSIRSPMGTAHDDPMNPKAFAFFATHHEIPALLLR